MKREIRVAAATAVETALREALGTRIVPVTVAKKDGFAFDTGVLDENGKPIYAVIEATIKNTEDTKTSKAFDLDEAVAAVPSMTTLPRRKPSPRKSTPKPKPSAPSVKRRSRLCMTG